MNDLKDIIISSRIRLARNFEGIPFPFKLTDEKSINYIFQSVQSAADKLFKYKIYKMKDTKDLNRIALVEQHIISLDLCNNERSGAVLVNDSEGVSIMVNEEDHVRAQCLLKGLQLGKAYELINNFDNELSKIANLAYDSQYGYLTCCPTNIGTGMRASVMVFLPALTMTHRMEGIIKDAQRSGLTVRGVYGEGSKADGFLYQISNALSLGSSEETIIKYVEKTVIKICNEEMNERQNLYANLPSELKDKVMRAYGILTHAYMLSSSEFMQLVSDVRLGISLNLIKLNNEDKLDMITTLAQPACLCLYAGKELNNEDRDIVRAEYVRNALSN